MTSLPSYVTIEFIEEYGDTIMKIKPIKVQTQSLVNPNKMTKKIQNVYMQTDNFNDVIESLNFESDDQKDLVLGRSSFVKLNEDYSKVSFNKTVVELLKSANGLDDLNAKIKKLNLNEISNELVELSDDFLIIKRIEGQRTFIELLIEDDGDDPEFGYIGLMIPYSLQTEIKNGQLNESQKTEFKAYGVDYYI